MTGSLNSRRSGANRVHLLEGDPLKMKRDAMSEESKEKPSRGAAVSPALVSDKDVACSSDGTQAVEFSAVQGGVAATGTTRNTDVYAYGEDEAVNAAAKRLKTRYAYRFTKRAFDVAFSLLVLICFCWLFAIVAIAIKLDDPKGPVLFKQKRVTKDGREFTMYKFRSMCADAEERLAELKVLNEKTGPVFKIHDDPRVTRVGHVIRKLSLDELPQFGNVLRGDLAVVGPRPALPSEVATYTPRHHQRLLVKSGITCFWQTRRNRDSITFDEWVNLDLIYIKKCGIWTDFKLIIQTVGCVLTAQGS